ncbi:hypothetical protein PoB_005115200 [Plakobranchus ocellatus]|uniref:Secreted protein n=1 Tax=Plakobranchus ocellatus TaxID=259542 RepID=A0AAV4C046_9GAST|nr:hypothetical protein PoB_005115200 [Plakobranchus ocellatus]
MLASEDRKLPTCTIFMCRSLLLLLMDVALGFTSTTSLTGERFAVSLLWKKWFLIREDHPGSNWLFLWLQQWRIEVNEMHNTRNKVLPVPYSGGTPYLSTFPPGFHPCKFSFQKRTLTSILCVLF